KEVATLVQTAAEGTSVAERQAAFDRLVALGYGDRVPWVPMLGRDLAQLPTCEERREAAAKLKKLNDPKALSYVQGAAQPPDNGCCQEGATRAPEAPHKRPATRSGGGGHF